MDFLQQTETNPVITALTPKIAAIIERVNQLPEKELPGAISVMGLAGYKCASMLNSLPKGFIQPWALPVLFEMVNLAHPQQNATCFASRETIMARVNEREGQAPVSISTVKRAIAKYGDIFFNSKRRAYSSAWRPLTAPAMRFFLIAYSCQKAGIGNKLTENLFTFLGEKVLGMTKKIVSRGRPKKCEPQKEPQHRRTSKLKTSITVRNFLGELTRMLGAFAQGLRPQRRSVPAWKRKQRDINAIAPVDTRIPTGFRGTEPVERSGKEFVGVVPDKHSPAHNLTKSQCELLPYYQANPESIPGPLLASYRRAGVWVEA